MEPLQYEARGYLKEPFRLFHLAGASIVRWWKRGIIMRG